MDEYSRTPYFERTIPDIGNQILGLFQGSTPYDRRISFEETTHNPLQSQSDLPDPERQLKALRDYNPKGLDDSWNNDAYRKLALFTKSALKGISSIALFATVFTSAMLISILSLDSSIVTKNRYEGNWNRKDIEDTHYITECIGDEETPVCRITELFGKPGKHFMIEELFGEDISD